MGEGVGVRKVDGLGSEVGWECQWSSCKKRKEEGRWRKLPTARANKPD